jgi:hypothetical protein
MAAMAACTNLPSGSPIAKSSQLSGEAFRRGCGLGVSSAGRCHAERSSAPEGIAAVDCPGPESEGLANRRRIRSLCGISVRVSD